MSPSYLCLARDVETGFRRVRLGRSSLLVARHAGKVVSDWNICPHRGFPLVGDELSGSLPLKCKYHGLSLRPKGTIPVFERGGLVFHGDGPGPLSYIPPVAARILDNIGEEFGSHVQTIEAPFDLWMQNTMDPGHLHSVHEGGFAKLFPSPVSVRLIQCLDESPISAYEIALSQETLDGYSKFRPSFGNGDSVFTHVSFFPNLSITSFMGVFISLERVAPIEPMNHSYVETRFFLDKRSAGVPRHLLTLALAANKKTLAEDKQLCETWAKGHYDFEPRNWMAGEERIRHYLGWCKKENNAGT